LIVSAAESQKPMADIPKIPDDEITRRLREAARRKRPWTLFNFLLTVLMFGPPLGLLVWWFWPRAHPPELIVIAFDQVAQPGKVVMVRAATEPLDGSENRWGGLDLFFEEVAPIGGHGGETRKVQTNEQGLAQTEWRLNTPAPVAEIEVRYLDEWMRPPWFDRARCRVFNWPPDARLLVVDIEPTLKNAGDWAALAKALAEAHKGGWQVAYLAVSADTPLIYRKLRDWMVQQSAWEPDALPAGPVLARQTLFGGQADAVARKKLLAGLKAEFAGPVLYITADQGLKLHTVGNSGDFTGEPVPVAGWAKLAAALPK